MKEMKYFKENNKEAEGTNSYCSTVAIGLGTADVSGKGMLPGWKTGYYCIVHCLLY